MNGKLRLPVGLVILPSVPDRRFLSFFFRTTTQSASMDTIPTHSKTEQLGTIEERASSQSAEVTGERMPTSVDTIPTHSKTERLGYENVPFWEAPRVLRSPEKQCPQVWIRFPPTRRPNNWGTIEERALLGSSQSAEVTGERMPTSVDTIPTHSKTERFGVRLKNGWSFSTKLQSFFFVDATQRPPPTADSVHGSRGAVRQRTDTHQLAEVRQGICWAVGQQAANVYARDCVQFRSSCLLHGGPTLDDGKSGKKLCSSHVFVPPISIGAVVRSHFRSSPVGFCCVGTIKIEIAAQAQDLHWFQMLLRSWDGEAVRHQRHRF